MKTRSLPVRLFTAVVVLFVALLAAPPAAHAQTAMKTNDIAFPWLTVIAGVSSNITSWGNAGGYAAGASVRIPSSALGTTFTWSFSCPTVTLAAASCVLQGSTDNLNFHNIPASSGGSGALVILVPASAASANNTNVVFSTNMTQALLGGYSWFRVASATNGNAATLTHGRLTAAYW